MAYSGSMIIVITTYNDDLISFVNGRRLCIIESKEKKSYMHYVLLIYYVDIYFEVYINLDVLK